MKTVTFQIPGKVESIRIEEIPRLKEIVVIWGGRWDVIDVIHEVIKIGGSKITISLYPSKN